MADRRSLCQCFNNSSKGYVKNQPLLNKKSFKGIFVVILKEIARNSSEMCQAFKYLPVTYNQAVYFQPLKIQSWRAIFL